MPLLKATLDKQRNDHLANKPPQMIKSTPMANPDSFTAYGKLNSPTPIILAINTIVEPLMEPIRE